MNERGLARALGAAAIVALLARLAFGLAYWTGKPLTHDEREYLLLAESLAHGRGFTYGDGRVEPAEAGPAAPARFGRAPLYPLFVAVVAGRGLEARATDSTPRALKIAQSIVGAVGVVLIGLIAARAVRPAGRAAQHVAGRAAAFVAAVLPPLVWICAYALTEALFSTLALGAVYALEIALDRHDDGDRRRSAWGAVAAGVLTGAAALTRPGTVIFLVMAVVWLAMRTRTALAVAFALGAALLIAPWTVRNAVVHGRLIVIASEGGITFWTGNHPAARGEGDLAANPDIKQSNLELRRRHPALTPEQLEPIYYREALAYIRAQPADWLGLVAKKLFYTWVPVGPSYALHSPRYRWASVLSYVTLLPFAVAGAVTLVRRATPPRALWLLAGSVVVMSLMFFPQERFRIPVLDPTLVVCAACWIALVGLPRQKASPTV